MDNYLSLTALAVFLLAFFAAMFYGIARASGSTMRQQLDAAAYFVRRLSPRPFLAALSHLARETVVSIATHVVPARRLERTFVDRHLRLCAVAGGSQMTLLMTKLLAEGPQRRDMATNSLTDAEARYDGAISDLRIFLGTLTDEEIILLVRGLRFTFFSSQIDEGRLREFFTHEREAADDASREEITNHRYRYLEVIRGPASVACQPAKNAL